MDGKNGFNKKPEVYCSLILNFTIGNEQLSSGVHFYHLPAGGYNTVRKKQVSGPVPA